MEKIKRSLKICFSGTFSFLLVYSILGVSPAILSGLGAIYGYLITFKGFHKRRIFFRTIKVLITINLVVLSAYFIKHNFSSKLIGSFFVIMLVTFFTFEEYIGGFMIYRPVLYIYLLSLQQKSFRSSLINMLGLSSGILISIILGVFFWPKDPYLKFPALIKNYLNNILIEVKFYQEKKNSKKNCLKTREAHQLFLKEFYKTISGSNLSSLNGKNYFNYMMLLHNLIEKVRLLNKKNEISVKELLDLEKILSNLKKDKIKTNYNCKLFKSDQINKIIENLYIKKKTLSTKEDNYNNYYHNYNYYDWIKRNFNLKSSRFSYSLKMSTALIFGLILVEFFLKGKSFWLLTIILVLVLPYGDDSIKKSLNRFIGTILGIVLSSILIPYIKDDYSRGFCAIIAFFPAFIFMGKNYPVVVTFTTFSTVLMNLSYGSINIIFKERILYTIIAGIIVIIVEELFKDRNSSNFNKKLLDMYKNDLKIINNIIYYFNFGLKDHIDDYLLNGYIYRELLVKYINKTEEKKYEKIVNKNIIFMDRLMLFYSELKFNNYSKSYIYDIYYIQIFLRIKISHFETDKFPKEELLFKSKNIDLNNVSLDTLDLIDYMIDF